jgi:hypothetical protein
MTIVEPVHTPSSQHGLHDLVAQGDRACASRVSAGLAEAAHLLGLCIPPPELFALLEIERLAPVDIATASALWQSVTPALRDKLFGPEPTESP